MKTIKNSKIIYAHVFVTALLLTLLTSLLTGIVVAPKPDKPGKPPFEPPPTQYYIFSIDIEGQELDLDTPANLVAETIADDSGWYNTPNKRTKVVEWGASLNELYPNGPTPEECGTYSVNLPNVPIQIDAQSFDIYYLWTLRQMRGLEYTGQANFWQFSISWGMNPTDPGDYSNTQSLHVWTDYNDEAEGTYYPTEDMWIIDFSGASWELLASHADGTVYFVEGGIISELTVTITNNGPVAS